MADQTIPGIREDGHTPGPWKATQNAYGCNFVQRWEPGEPHGVICGGNNHDTLTRGDALLIAAAPDLLAACIAFMPKGIALGNHNVPDDMVVPMDVTMGELRAFAAAIAKASPTTSEVRHG